MGLDLALGGLVLVSAVRGWLKGFLAQAIRLGGIVAAVYAAAPLRDQARPYVAEYLATIRPDLLDRLIWWAAAVLAYFVIVAVGSLAVGIGRKNTFGLNEANRGDQFAGFGLGLIKGLILASFLVAGVQRRAQPLMAQLPWAQEQIKESTAWHWHEQYRPADQIWSAPPVQQFVGQIQKNGLLKTPPAHKPKSEAEISKPVQTASRVPKLALPPTPSATDPELLQMVESLRAQLDALDLPR
jgi:uncharacterized membrane protein required for colicin V production